MVLKLRDRILAVPGADSRPLTPDEMLRLAEDVDLAELELGEYRCFSNEGYARNTVLKTDQFELVVICWQAGQRSTIHDHGESQCLYLVTGGTMTEEVYERAGNGDARLTLTRDWGQGAITIADGPTIHRVCNHTDEDLVTVHLYSPPLPMPPNTFEATAE